DGALDALVGGEALLGELEGDVTDRHAGVEVLDELGGRLLGRRRRLLGRRRRRRGLGRLLGGGGGLLGGGRLLGRGGGRGGCGVLGVVPAEEHRERDPAGDEHEDGGDDDGQHPAAPLLGLRL